MPAELTGPDVRQLNDQPLIECDFPGGRDQVFRVFMDPVTHDEIWKHASADTNVEICGVLVGKWAKDEKGPFLGISASIRGEAAAKKFAEVTFTHDTWAAINAEMDSKYADRSIVGWYHTHPDFGIFLSERDRFIQENFFSAPGQVALVVDPLRKIEGLFVWMAGKPQLAPHYWVGNRLTVSADNDADSRSQSATRTTADMTLSAANPTSTNAAAWLSLAQKALQYLLVFLVGWLLAGHLNDLLLDRVRREGVALAVYQYGLRPDLELRLSELQVDLSGIGKVSEQIAADHQRRLNDKDIPAEEIDKQKAAWKEMELRINRSMALLSRVEQEYCLDDQQRALVKRIFESQVRRSPTLDDKSKGSEPIRTEKPSEESAKKKATQAASEDTPPAKKSSASTEKAETRP